jgi:pectin methylesterase-like acyl-CoA thioesterase
VSFACDASAVELKAVAEGLLNHPVLSVEDARVFTALLGLASHLAERLGAQQAEMQEEEEDEGLQPLFEVVMGAVATAAMVVRYTSPADMGLVIETAE